MLVITEKPARKRKVITHVKVLRTEAITRPIQVWNGKKKIWAMDQVLPEGSTDRPFRSTELCWM
jgi:hypothetical protein